MKIQWYYAFNVMMVIIWGIDPRTRIVQSFHAAIIYNLYFAHAYASSEKSTHLVHLRSFLESSFGHRKFSTVVLFQKELRIQAPAHQ